jgi:DNA-binding NtrC family response regulator
MSSRDVEPLIERASHALERWSVDEARGAAEQARAVAVSWGDAAGAARADILLARATLLISAHPAELVPSTPELGARFHGDVKLQAALERLEAELSLAGVLPARERESLALETGEPADRVAAVAIASVARLKDSGRLPYGFASDARTQEPGEPGWESLISAVGAEARGRSGIECVEQVISLGEREGRLALLWTALELRALLCERRSADDEALETRKRMRSLVQRWALTLPATDSTSALARPDRAALRLLDARPADRRTPTLLTEVGLALSQERDPHRLMELALDAAIRVTGAERGILLIAGEDGTQHVVHTRYCDGEAAEGLVGLSSTIARRALSDGEVVLSNDIRSDARFSDCASVALGVVRVLCAPIHARGEVEGAIYLDRRSRGQPFEAASVDAARTVGAALAAALLSARTIAALEARTRELELVRDELDRALAARTVERDQASRRLASLEDVTPAGVEALVGSSPVMLRLRRLIQTVGSSDAPVLVGGETGTGKELVARAIHAASARRDQAFVAVNCAALSENLLAAELFGSERGAYTGATAARPGLFVAAHGGTLFLDEVGDMPPAMQKALLRVLETAEVRAVGSASTRRVDVRLVAASHRDLAQLVQAGSFREDLLFRLEVVRVMVPPLRERLDDLPALCERLLHDTRKRYNLPDRRLSAEALGALRLRRWPGNVRELRHVLAGATLNAVRDLITPADLPPERGAGPAQTESLIEDEDNGHALRAAAIRRALRATKGHRARAAKLLGISRATLYRYCETYQVEMRDFDAPQEGVK